MRLPPQIAARLPTAIRTAVIVACAIPVLISAHRLVWDVVQAPRVVSVAQGEDAAAGGQGRPRERSWARPLDRADGYYQAAAPGPLWPMLTLNLLALVGIVAICALRYVRTKTSA